MICGLLDLEGGGVVDFYGSWVARGAPTSFDGDWHVECANGQVRWSGNRIFVRAVEPWLTIQMDGFLEREDGWMEAELPVGVTEDRTRVLEVFHDCLRDGREPPTSGRDNLRTAALSFALEDSARDGAPRELAGYLAGANTSRLSAT
jgi:predicted dehydrogenase